MGYGIYDHKHASIAEDRYLKNAIFKFGSVCEIPDIKPTQRIELDGPIEILVEHNSPLKDPNILLNWGFPIVRQNGVDYYLANPKDRHSITNKPAMGSSTVELTEVSEKNGYGNINIKLAKRIGGKEIIAFDAHWPEPQRGNFYFYCPRYIDNHETMEPLRSLIVSSFNNLNADSK